MQPPRQLSRINLAELKAQIVKKLGPEGSKQYFQYLNRFLSLKLNKVEFNKLCLKILGRENIPLHNHFLRSILKNACTAKTPPVTPPNQKEDFSKHSTQVLQNGSHHGVTGPPGLSNGVDLLPVSPRKARSALSRGGDRRSALGHHKNNVSHQTSDVRVLENGDMHLMQWSESSKDSSTVRTSEDDQAHPVYRKDRMVNVEGKDASAKIPLQAPLGVTFGSQKVLPNRYMGTSNEGALLNSFALREQMEKIAKKHGLEGVSPECANVLNHGLDSYLKGIIRSCTELVGKARSDHESTNNDLSKQLSYLIPINGLKPGFQNPLRSSIDPLEVQEQHSRQYSVSLQNLRVAMELNPRQLGEDWPCLIERISICEFDE